MSTKIDAADQVRDAWYDVVGFSIASDIHIAPLSKRIVGVRRASRNRHIAVMIGGPAFLRRPGLVTELGADGAAVDAQDAVHQATLLVVARIAAE
jgi:hypothetical protein